MVNVKLKDLNEAPEDLVQFVRHLQENYKDIESGYNLTISITSEDYTNLSGSEISGSSKYNIEEKGVKLLFEWDNDIPRMKYIDLAEGYYGKNNYLVVGENRGSEDEREIYIFEKRVD